MNKIDVMHAPANHPASAEKLFPCHQVRTRRAVFLLTGLTLLLNSVIYAPLSGWPLGFVCLAPWVLAVVSSTIPRRVYVASYLFGAVFYAINVRWLYPVTLPGYVALCIYMGCYFPLMAVGLRNLVRRRRWPVALSLPILWIGGEWLRSVIVTGFPWFYLSHSQYQFKTFIQISDLVGAYGPSFVMAMVNGLIVDFWLRIRANRSSPFLLRQRKNLVKAGIATVVFFALTLGYGWYRISQSDVLSPGPRLATIQGDYLNSTNEQERLNEPGPRDRARFYFEQMLLAAEHEPDLFALPESAWSMVLNPEFRLEHSYGDWHQAMYESLQSFARKSGACIVVGAGTIIPRPGVLSATKDPRWGHFEGYNSAYVFKPDGSDPGRYDKVHLVLFGEYVPFRLGSLRWLYLWFNELSPWGSEDREYSMEPGKSFHVFDLKAPSLDGQVFQFGIPICYEDVMPYVSREFVVGEDGRKKADFLVNISNDGWFLHSHQQPQHLAICTFRAVENRVPIVRSVNTGVSAVIDSVGRIVTRVNKDGRWYGEGVDGYAVASINIDSRTSFYSRSGDWFAIGCAILSGLCLVDYVLRRTLPAAA